MKLKKYVVKDIREALENIKRDLGEDAVILSTRKIRRGGFLKLGGKTYLEVTAVVEDDQRSKPEKNNIYKFQEIIMKNKEKRQEEELRELKSMIQEMKGLLVSSRRQEMPHGIRKITDGLEKQEIDAEVISKILEYLKITHGDVDLENEELRSMLSEYVLPFIKTEVPELRGSVLFVGPTGVGKTTTLAKIAAKIRLEEKRQVAILTLDTYRIAAPEQLKTYATIMDIPMRVAYTPREAKLELDAMSSFEVILIDTAGRSQNNDIQISELRAMTETLNPNVSFLVLGMNCKYSDLNEILRKFSVSKISHIILTKMDETKSYGHLVNASYTSGLPIAFITNGQQVPEDIFPANRRELALLLAKEVLKYAKSG